MTQNAIKGPFLLLFFLSFFFAAPCSCVIISSSDLLQKRLLASSPHPELQNPKTKTKPKNFPECHENWHEWPSGVLCQRTQQPWLTTQIMMVTFDILAPKLLPEEGKKKGKKSRGVPAPRRKHTHVRMHTHRRKRSP